MEVKWSYIVVILLYTYAIQVITLWTANVYLQMLSFAKAKSGEELGTLVVRSACIWRQQMGL